MWHGRAMTCALGVAIVAAFALSVEKGYTQSGYGANDAPNPYKFDYGWAKLPDGRKWGAAVGVDIDRDGKSVWVFDRCETATDCSKSKLDPIMKFDATGKMVKSFGGGMINYSHGLLVDPDNNIWVTDGRAMNNGKGHTVMKFTKDGKYIKEWGKKGTGPGEFDTPHRLALDSAGRLFVADRSNNRVQVFDQDGKYLLEWKQFGRPSGLFIDKNDVLYVADNSPDELNPPYKSGIRIGSVKDGKVMAFILESVEVNGLEAVAVDDAGNVYGGYTNTLNFRRWVKKQMAQR